MYTPETILVLKVPHPPDEETEQEFPYNRVKVIGPSPIDHGMRPEAQWSGANAQGVILLPMTSFGGNLDEPLGKVQALYDIESEPEAVYEVTQKIKIVNSATRQAGRTPEEVFAAEAPGKPASDDDPVVGHDSVGNPVRRARTQSPLEDPRPDASDGPLGPVVA